MKKLINKLNKPITWKSSMVASLWSMAVAIVVAIAWLGYMFDWHKNIWIKVQKFMKKFHR